MRKFSSTRAFGAALVACLALAIAPAADAAASPDLINQVQNQINASPTGMLPTTPADQQTFIDNLVAAGVLSSSQASEAVAALNAIAGADPATGAAAVAEAFVSGLTPAQIGALAGVLPTTAYNNFLSSYNLDGAPTGNALAPLSAAMRQLAGTLPAGEGKSALISLADQIDAAGLDELPEAVLNQIRAAIALVGAAAGDPLAGLNKLIGQLVPSPKTTTSTPGPSVPVPVPFPVPVPVGVPVTPFSLSLKVRKITVDAKRKTAKVMLRSAAPTAVLPVSFTTKLGSKSAAKVTKFNLATGKDVTKKIKLTRATTKALKKKGGSLKVTPTIAIPGLTSVAGVTVAQTAKSLKVKKPRTRRRSRR